MTQPRPSLTETSNKISAVALRLLDNLLLKNPERTAIGVALGLALDGVITVVWPVFAERGIHLGRPDWWASVSLGIVLVHLPFIAWSVRNKPLINDELESLIQLIEATNIGEIEKRVAYRKLVNRCIEDFALSTAPGKIKARLRAEAERLGS